MHQALSGTLRALVNLLDGTKDHVLEPRVVQSILVTLRSFMFAVSPLERASSTAASFPWSWYARRQASSARPRVCARSLDRW